MNIFLYLIILSYVFTSKPLIKFNMLLVVNTSGFFMFLINLIYLSFSSSSLFIQWVCLEVGILCVIPLLINFSTSGGVKLSVKYFISQRPASVVLIISVLLINKLDLTYYFFSLAIFFKLGIPPFQGWIFNIIPLINFWSIFLLLTMQKFIPLIILRRVGIPLFLSITSLFIFIIIIIIFINLINSSYYLLLISSLLNVFWVLNIVDYSLIWVDFIVVYALISRSFIFIINIAGLNFIRDLLLADRLIKRLAVLRLLNIRGIPPFTGFIIKLIILKPLIVVGLLYSSILIFASIMIIFIYINISYQLNRMKFYFFRFNSFNIYKLGIIIRSLLISPLVYLIVLF